MPWHRFSDWIAGRCDGRRGLPHVAANGTADATADGTADGNVRDATGSSREPSTAHVTSLIKVLDDRAEGERIKWQRRTLSMRPAVAGPRGEAADALAKVDLAEKVHKAAMEHATRVISETEAPTAIEDALGRPPGTGHARELARRRRAVDQAAKALHDATVTWRRAQRSVDAIEAYLDAERVVCAARVKRLLAFAERRIYTYWRHVIAHHAHAGRLNELLPPALPALPAWAAWAVDPHRPSEPRQPQDDTEHDRTEHDGTEQGGKHGVV